MYTDHYTEFKQEIHKLFPVVIDTKNLCFALQKVGSIVPLDIKSVSIRLSSTHAEASRGQASRLH